MSGRRWYRIKQWLANKIFGGCERCWSKLVFKHGMWMCAGCFAEDVAWLRKAAWIAKELSGSQIKGELIEKRKNQ